MHPVFVDFSTARPRTGNAEVRSDSAFFAGDHLALDAGGSVEIDFTVPPGGIADEATLKIRALVSKLGASMGSAPLDLTVNGITLATGYRIPGGGDLPQEIVLVVPAELLHPGPNTLVLRSAEQAQSHLWLYRVLLEQVWDRDGAERALLEEDFRTSLLSYRTERRAPGAEAWEPGPTWRLHIDGGERGLPSRLDWRSRSGAEASVLFALELYSCYGHYRDSDGAWFELRGELTDRAPFPADSAPRFTQRFDTEAGWGGRWHRGGPLVLHLEVGEESLERVSWQDRRACSAAIGFAPDDRSFLGWSQRVNEGPVGYRGTLSVPVEPPKAVAGPFGQELEEIGETLGRLADAATRQLADWWRKI